MYVTPAQDQVPERAVRISRGSRIRDDPRERGRGTAPVPSRIVAIAVVQQDDGTRSKLAAHPHADLLGRHPGVRVPHAERPTEHRVAETSGGDAHERVAVAVRRTEAAWDPARRVDDQLVRALELLADPARPPKVQFLVAQGVVSDLMPRRGHPAGDLP